MGIFDRLAYKIPASLFWALAARCILGLSDRATVWFDDSDSDEDEEEDSLVV